MFAIAGIPTRESLFLIEYLSIEIFSKLRSLNFFNVHDMVFFSLTNLLLLLNDLNAI